MAGVCLDGEGVLVVVVVVEVEAEDDDDDDDDCSAKFGCCCSELVCDLR